MYLYVHILQLILGLRKKKVDNISTSQPSCIPPPSGLIVEMQQKSTNPTIFKNANAFRAIETLGNDSEKITKKKI